MTFRVQKDLIDSLSVHFEVAKSKSKKLAPAPDTSAGRALALAVAAEEHAEVVRNPAGARVKCNCIYASLLANVTVFLRRF